jgi:alginate O-acetyltransferase complex protein AlgI
LLFNSIAFLLFLPIVFTGYWFVVRKSMRAQNLLLLAASYVFYGWWDWRFLSLIIVSSAVDYAVGIGLEKAERTSVRRTLLTLSLTVNLGLLGFFKYFDFFVDSLREALLASGISIGTSSLHIVLPVGISFYTFQTLSYSIDVYRRKVPTCRDPLSFFAYVSFFPQLVAGPIERARALLPQFTNPRKFEYDAACDGMRQILWGFLKKVVIADNVAVHVQRIFSDPGSFGGPELFLGAFFFAIQIYCDFSGYSDIAIGVARLFGFKLMRNFAFPYFSRDIAEFWRRWHISLSSWFRDYVYIPLGGSRTDMTGRLRNVLITFGVSGLWHGANWTFVFWGLLNGLYYVPLLLRGVERRFLDQAGAGRILPGLTEFLRILLTFLLTLLAWVFFRAKSIGEAFSYLGAFASRPFQAVDAGPFLWAFSCCLLFLAAEWFQRERQHALDIRGWPVWLRWATYLAVLFIIFIFGRFSHQEFIYFQF